MSIVAQGLGLFEPIFFQSVRFSDSAVARTRLAMRGGNEFVEDAVVSGGMPNLALRMRRDKTLLHRVHRPQWCP